VAGWRNWLEDLSRLAANRPPVGTEAYRPGVEVAATPGEVVFRNHLIELIALHAGDTTGVPEEPVLVVPSWIMKYYILDLSPNNSLVRYLLQQGHAVYMVSWAQSGRVRPRPRHGRLPAEGRHGGHRRGLEPPAERPIQAVGYCLGGTLLAIAAARMAHLDDHRLRSLTLLASQVDFSEPGELAIFIDEAQLAYLDDLMAAQGYLDGKQMAGAFALLNQRDLVFSRMVHDYLMGRRRPVSDLHAWNADATRMPFRQHREYLQSLYHHNDLAQGRYKVLGQPVALSDIRAAGVHSGHRA
jgi:polyhydroxyalkanoate synthase